MEMPQAVFKGISDIDTSVTKEELFEVNQELVKYLKDLTYFQNLIASYLNVPKRLKKMKA